MYKVHVYCGSGSNDEYLRVTLPIDLIKTFDLEQRDMLHVSMDSKVLVLRYVAEPPRKTLGSPYRALSKVCNMEKLCLQVRKDLVGFDYYKKSSFSTTLEGVVKGETLRIDLTSIWPMKPKKPEKIKGFRELAAKFTPKKGFWS